MISLERRFWPLIAGLLLGALTVQFVHLATHLYEKQVIPLNGLPAVTDSQKVSKHEFRKTGSKTTCQTPSVKIDIPDRLFKKVRILCLIMIHPANYKTKAVAVNNTWARRCNQYVFVGSNSTTVDIPLIRLNITEGRGTLWQKTWMSFEYAVKNLNISEFDFVLKAHDDTFAVMENLRLLLLPLDPNYASLIGRRFRYGVAKKFYMSGGAGYVLSRQAVQLFVQRAINGRDDPCKKWVRSSEDFMLGSCLLQFGVKFIDSRDSNRLDRFHPLSADYMIGWGPSRIPPWMKQLNYFPFKLCVKGCVSSMSATFHYVPMTEMYIMEFFLYGMRPVGVDPTDGDTKIAELLGKM